MSNPLAVTVPDQTRPSAWPATFTFLIVGDSNAFGTGLSDYDNQAISAGVDIWKQGVQLTGNYAVTTGDGLVAYIAETLIANGTTTAVQAVDEAVAGAYTITIRRDQMSDALDMLETRGWATSLDMAVIQGWVNDMSANGDGGATGDWNNVAGSSITDYGTRLRCDTYYYRVRNYHPEAVIVFVLPTNDPAEVPDADVIRAAIIAYVEEKQAEGDVNCRYADTYGSTFGEVVVHQDYKHWDQDDATKGAQAIADLILAEYYTP
jgi:hypothetical protein